MRVIVKAKCCTPKTAYQLLRGDRLVGLALALANGTWAAFSCDGHEDRLSSQAFNSPQSVAKWAQRTGLGA